MIADDVSYHVGDLFAFRHLDALVVAPAHHVFARMMLQVGRQGRADCLHVLVQPRHPERQPAMTGFQTAKAQSRETIEQSAADQRGHVAHAAPRMRRGTLKPEIVPGVEPARRVGRHHRERMQHRRQIQLLRLGPDRIERRQIDRCAVRRIDQHAPRPTLATGAAHLLDAAGHIARADQHHAAQALGELSAIVRHPAMERAIHAHFQRDIVACGEGAEPAGWQHEVHIGALEVHVGDARGGRTIDVGCDGALPLYSGEARHVAGRRRIRRFGVEPPLILALALVEGDVTASAGRLVLFPIGQPRPVVCRQVRFENIDVRADVCVGIEELVAVACHGFPPTNQESVPPDERRYFSSAAGDR